MTESKINQFANDMKKLAKKCCIYSKKFNGYGNNPAPYKENGSCCNKCNHDYVIPSNLSENEVRKELRKFRKQYKVFPYNVNERLTLEIGERIIKGIQEVGYFIVTSMKTDTLIEGKTVPICTMSKLEVVECMEKYLSSIGKTLDSWIKETGYQLYWNRMLFIVAEAERLQISSIDDDMGWVEPLIESDTDSIERLAESATVSDEESLIKIKQLEKKIKVEKEIFDFQLHLTLFSMIAREIFFKIEEIDKETDCKQETYSVEWIMLSEFAYIIYLFDKEIKVEFADFLDIFLNLWSMKLDRNKGVYGMDVAIDDKHKVTFHIRRRP